MIEEREEERTLGERRAEEEVPDYPTRGQARGPVAVPGWYFRSCASIEFPPLMEEDYAPARD